VQTKDQGVLTMSIGGSDHILREPLRAAIAGMDDPDDIIEAVLVCLADNRLIGYRGDELPLLSAAGRVLVDLVRHPTSTLRESSMRLGTTESTVAKQMTNLVRANLIKRTRVGMRNHYEMDVISVLSHPDSATLVDALLLAGGYASTDSGDSAFDSDCTST
jgi:hypothetical protein